MVAEENTDQSRYLLGELNRRRTRAASRRPDLRDSIMLSETIVLIMSY